MEIPDVWLADTSSSDEIRQAMNVIIRWVDIKDPQQYDIENAIVLLAQAVRALASKAGD